MGAKEMPMSPATALPVERLQTDELSHEP